MSAPMTAQGIFDTVATHLFTQGEQATAFSEDACEEMCLYRTDAGHKCAAGVMIADEDYRPNMELKDIGWVVRTYEEMLPSVAALAPHLPLMTRLQNAHDTPRNWETTSTMQMALKAEIEDYHMNYPQAPRVDPKIVDTLSFADR